jgi:hypothetical protein
MSELEEMFLNDFGVMEHVVENVSSEKVLHDPKLFADRYGGTGGSPHGGSGRCAMLGRYNAKGIGRTPLVSDKVDWWHSTGLMWLSEGIREAISSELAHFEQPYGAVPTIAIIDTGIDVQRDSVSRIERCGIAVRANFMRPAHFERSIYFGSSGFEGSDQHLDAIRVEKLTKLAMNNDGLIGSLFPGFLPMMKMHAEQIGAARALRLWQGRFLTSNASIDGRLADFGSFRQVVNWRRSVGQSNEVFGAEGTQLNAAAHSLSFYLYRHFDETTARNNLPKVYQEIQKSTDQSFKTQCHFGFAVDHICETGRAIDYNDAIAAFYLAQQEVSGGADDLSIQAHTWLPDVAQNPRQAAQMMNKTEFKIARELVLQIKYQDAINSSTLFSQSVFNWLTPRRALFHKVAVTGAISLVDNLKGGEELGRVTITDYISAQVGASRRVFREIPKHVLIKSQLYDRGTWLVLTDDQHTSATGGYVIAPCNDDRVLLFGVNVDRVRLVEFGDKSNSSKAVIALGPDSICSANGTRLLIAGQYFVPRGVPFSYTPIEFDESLP